MCVLSNYLENSSERAIAIANFHPLMVPRQRHGGLPWKELGTSGAKRFSGIIAPSRSRETTGNLGFVPKSALDFEYANTALHEPRGRKVR